MVGVTCQNNLHNKQPLFGFLMRKTLTKNSNPYLGLLLLKWSQQQIPMLFFQPKTYMKPILKKWNEQLIFLKQTNMVFKKINTIF